MQWRKLTKGQYELVTQNFDFYLCENMNKWTLDIFQHKISNNRDAYLDTLEVDSFRNGKVEAESYI